MEKQHDLITQIISVSIVAVLATIESTALWP